MTQRNFSYGDLKFEKSAFCTFVNDDGLSALIDGLAGTVFTSPCIKIDIYHDFMTPVKRKGFQLV